MARVFSLAYLLATAPPLGFCGEFGEFHNPVYQNMSSFDLENFKNQPIKDVYEYNPVWSLGEVQTISWDAVFDRYTIRVMREYPSWAFGPLIYGMLIFNNFFPSFIAVYANI